ncbi:MAG: carbohydrate kinase family protein [Acidobacteriaceae bacterium]
MAHFDLTVAGEVNLDLILYGLPESLPLNRELLASNFELTLGSSSAILAHNISLLGMRTGFITRAGDDELGRIAMERLAQSQVDLSRAIRSTSGTKTGVSILLAHGGTRRILTYPGVMFEMTCADLDLDYLCSARHFHLSSIFLQQGLHAGLPDLFRTLKQRGLTISLDTNDDPDDRWDGVLDEVLPYVDALLPNDEEILRIARRDTVEAALDALAARIPLIAVKCGSRGALVQQGTKRIQVPGVSVTPFDTVGAGDTFNTGFLSAWLRGADAETCARAGNITGALSTLRPGGTEAFRDGALREEFLRQHAYPFPL